MANDPEATQGADVPGHTRSGLSSKRGGRRTAIVVGVALAVVLGAVAFLGTVVVSSYVMEGSSMEPTYENGDRVWVNALGSADVGSIAVVRIASLDGIEVLKRVVASGGDTVEITDCQLIINDQADPTVASSSRCNADFDRITVPEEHLFLLGDNRGESRDSRHFGPVPEGDVLGVVIGS